MPQTRFYSSTAVPTTSTALINASATTLPVAATTGFPGSTPYTLILEPDTANEEVVTVTGVAGLNLTIVRGQDGTAGVSHAAGSVVRHGVSARDFAGPNLHAGEPAGVHGVTGNVVGTTDAQTLTNKTLTSPVVNTPTVSGGTFSSPTINTPTITTPTVGSFVNAQHDHSNAAGGGAIPQGAVTGLPTALPPIGSIIMHGASSPPTGWLRCDGVAVSRTTYAALFAVLGTTWGAGDGSTTFNLPNMTDKFPRFSTAGTSGGANSVTLTTNNLPQHSHSIDHNHAEVTSASSGGHTHNMGQDVQSPGSGTGYTHVTQVNDGESNSTGLMSTAGAHTHTVDLPAFTGTSGTGGGVASPSAVDTLPEYVGVTFMVRAL